MLYRGANVICSDEPPCRCVVVIDGYATAYFENQAAALAYVDMVSEPDQKGISDD
jgi:hypothetical protein